jgi:hypothetical protein
MATPYAGFGCVLQVKIVSTLTTIAAVRDIAGPAVATNPIDASTRTARARAFLPGMRDSGEVTFDIAYDPDENLHSASVAGGMVKLQQDATVCDWKLLFPAETTVVGAAFSGFVTGFNVKEPMDDLMTADLTIKISGEVTWA